MKNFLTVVVLVIVYFFALAQIVDASKNELEMSCLDEKKSESEIRYLIDIKREMRKKQDKLGFLSELKLNYSNQKCKKSVLRNILSWERGLDSKSTLYQNGMEDFEGSFPGSYWFVGDLNYNNGYDYWDDTNHRSFNGSWSGWCADIGSHPEWEYDNYQESYMYVECEYWGLWGNYTNFFDYYVWSDVEGYEFDWLKVEVEGFIDEPPHGLNQGNPDSWSATNWTDDVHDWDFKDDQLNSGYDDCFYLRIIFWFISDYSITYEGIYIDDIDFNNSSGHEIYPIPGGFSGSQPTTTPTRTPTRTPTSYYSRTPTRTPTRTRTPTKTPTDYYSKTPTRTPTRTRTPTKTPTYYYSKTPTRTPTRTRTPTKTPTNPPGSTYTPTRTPTATRTATPGTGPATRTPTNTPTKTPTTYHPTPTPTLPARGEVTITMPFHLFQPGDFCNCVVNYRMQECNENIPLFVILNVWGEYYFAPSFSLSMDHYWVEPDVFFQSVKVVDDFYWPHGAGNADGIIWWAALVDSSYSRLLCENVAEWEFGWRD